jgi:sigma-B regulation protein RsbU (phosphoserine phosphatase)
MSPRPSQAWLPVRRFLAALFAAIGDRQTYDLHKNPSLWVGALLAVPIPVLTWAAGSPLWLRLISVPAPLVWAILLGAVGRIGLRATEEQERLAGQVRDTLGHLDKEKDRRRALESEREDLVSELKLAQAVQATLLPEPIRRPDVEVVARSIPTRYIGGDYVHANVIEDRWLYLVLMDVSGHGISAAMVVARLHGMVRRLTLTKQRPVQMLQRLNTAAQRLLQHTYFFLTAVTMRLDLVNGELDYATAGHPAQILLRRDGAVEPLRTRNRLLGMDDDIISRAEPSRRIMIQPGDSVVLFSDGVLEVLKDGRGAVLGEEGLRQRIAGLGSLSPQFLIGEVLQELSEYQGRSEFEDDVTLLVATYLGAPLESAGEAASEAEATSSGAGTSSAPTASANENSP